MKNLTTAFLKIFFRNPRAWFFVIFLPAMLFVAGAFLGLESVIQVNSGLRYHDYLLVGILAMALMQTGIYGMSYLMIDWRKSQILRRLFITPLSPFSFLFSLLLSRFLITVFQAAAIILLGVLVFGVELRGLMLLPLLAFAGLGIFLNFGLIIASFSRDYEEAAPYTTAAGLSLIFLGDVFFPTKNLPAALSAAGSFLPLKPLSQSLRHFLLGAPSPDLGRDLLVILAWFAATSLLVPIIFKKQIYK